MSRPLTVVALTIAVFAVSGSANACSMAGCLGEGVEMRSKFVVAISHGGKPLTGVAVQISGNGKQFTVFTTSDGKARIDDLPAGLYWLDAQFLGIGAAYDCFHVADQPTNKAKRRLTYTWGDEAPSTKRISGNLIDSQPNKAGAPLWNILHPVDVPIVGANLKLQDPTAGTIFTTISDSQGYFAFEAIPAGVYVLHIEGGSAGDRGTMLPIN
jgi:Carboxypeptidase regulatory-like domain